MTAKVIPLDEETRAKVLDADPDGIDWKIQLPATQPSRVLTWFDAMISLLGNLHGFHELVARRMRERVAKRALVLPVIDGQGAMQDVLLEVLEPLSRVRAMMMHKALETFRSTGVPESELSPQLVGQNWGRSELRDNGVMHMRLELWRRNAPADRYRGEHELRIAIPRDAKCVRVIG